MVPREAELVGERPDRLAPELLGLVQHVAAYERLTVRAALSRDPADARTRSVTRQTARTSPLPFRTDTYSPLATPRVRASAAWISMNNSPARRRCRS